MLNGSYYYNGTIKKIVSVFGTLFNNIYTGKVVSGKMMNVNRVPLAYGPKEHFLMRIHTNESAEYPTDVAIKLPRMSFEMTSILYDSASKLNKINQRTFPVSGDNSHRVSVYQSVPYIIGMQLSIIARSQDDALQIFEQIVPTFTPEYTLTVKDLEGPGTLVDVPIILSSTNFTDSYEGDYASTRRLLVYTLDFSIKVRFVGNTNGGPRPIIKIADAGIHSDMNIGISEPFDNVNVKLGDLINDTPDDYTVITTFGFDDVSTALPISISPDSFNWTIVSQEPTNITAQFSPIYEGVIPIGSNTVLTTPNHLTMSTRYRNDPNDQNTGDRDNIGRRYLMNRWPTLPVFSTEDSGPDSYGSSGVGSYIRVYYNDVKVLDSTDGQIVLAPDNNTVIIALGHVDTLTFRIEQAGDGFIHSGLEIVYD